MGVVECFLEDLEELVGGFGADGDADEFWVDVVVGEVLAAFGCADQVVVGEVHEGADHGVACAEAWAFEEADGVVEVGEGAFELDGEQAAGCVGALGKLLVVVF